MLSELKNYSQLMLLQDVPEQKLEKVDVGTIVEILQDADGHSGYAIEFLMQRVIHWL